MLSNGDLVTETAGRLVTNISESTDEDLAEVDDLIVIAAVHYGTAEDGNADVSSTFYAASSGMVHRQLGLLEEARRAILESIRSREEDDAS